MQRCKGYFSLRCLRYTLLDLPPTAPLHSHRSSEYLTVNENDCISPFNQCMALSHAMLLTFSEKIVVFFQPQVTTRAAAHQLPYSLISVDFDFALSCS